MIDGFEKYGDGKKCSVLISDSVRDFLSEQMANDGKNVRKIGQILVRLGEHDLQGVNNTEQFKGEGKYKNGQAEGGRVTVYAVKAHQLRVYGGFVNVGTKRTFVCIEAARKKRDRADQNQLMRVAKAIGEMKW